jgi:hypothetical protein
MPLELLSIGPALSMQVRVLSLGYARIYCEEMNVESGEMSWGT